jgi:RNA polymerase sigma factor (sigma-70 family)
MVWSNEVSDPDIVRLIRDDPQRGFTLLLGQYGGRIHGYLRQRFPSFDESDLHDAVTDAMLALADSFDQRRGTLPAWFLLLAHQQAVRMLKSRRSIPGTVALDTCLEEVDRGDEPLTRLETLERLQEAQQAIQALPALERAVLEADLAEGLTVDAQVLAQRLNTTRGSIYAARKRARARLIDKCNWVREFLQSGKEGHG